MNRKIYEVILLIWFLSFVYLLVGAIVFNKATIIGLALIGQSQVILLIIILLTATYIFPKNWEKKRWGAITVQITSLNLLCILVRYIMEEIIFVRYLGAPKSEQLNPLFFIYDNFYYTLPGFFIGFITFLIFRTFAIEKRNNELKTAVQAAELNFLKSQVNPHFLYNVLNYMYSVSLPLSEKLSNTITKLASTMRYTLTKSEIQISPLKEEIEFIQDYIDLQSTQFDQGIQYTFIKEIEDDQIMFPTLTFIAFIENAFKHGIVDDQKSPLKIILKATKDHVNLDVENRINKSQKDPCNGIGLTNVRRRLNILFPSSHSLRIFQDNDLYSIQLNIILQK